MTEEVFARLLEDVDKGRKHQREIIERDDGDFTLGGGWHYVAPFKEWIPVERRALRYVRGRVLDLGSGAGRVLIELQRRGLDAVGIELSPAVARLSRRRGARNVKVMNVEDVDRVRGKFDTVVMYGNNFGMLGSIPKTRRLVGKLHGVTSEHARILAGSLDYTRTKDPLHLAYHERNARRGRPRGRIRIRLRHRNLVTPWFNWLFLSPAEVEQLVEGTGWHVARLVEDEGEMYVAILERD